MFDDFGTLMDVDAAAREAAAEPEMQALKDLRLSIAKSWLER